MASGSSQGKPAGVFANGLPSFAALARLTAGHFSSAAHKKAAALNNNSNNNNNNNTNGKNQLQKQQQQLFESQQAAASRQLGAQQVGSLASPPGPFSLAQQQQQQQRPRHEHEHERREPVALQMAGRPNGRAEAASEDEERAAARCYADQLRRGQLHQRLQGVQAAAGEQAGAGEQQRRPPECKQKQQQQQQQRAVHVNFGLARSSQANALDGDELEGGESGRKKKYLTAKYGAQQMSLIKKRLKIEMWLHERLEELTSASKALPAGQLDELDIDLDQLLDLEDERARREHLGALLAPLADVPRDSLERFIGEVLEQSKLL